LGKIIFLRRFISNFVELVKYITTMLRRGNEVKWTTESQDSFDQIKNSLTKEPIPISPDYSRDFMIFSFSSFDIVAVVLLQKNVEGLEQPISFFSRVLRDAKIKYDIMEEKAYALVKSFKDFRVYFLHSNIVAYVPSSSMKEILIQPIIDGRGRKWIAKSMEFDLEINPTKLVKGQGLSRLMAESNCKDLGVNFININSENQRAELANKGYHVKPKLAECTWYKEIIYFL
jgi:hypothetical protein